MRVPFFFRNLWLIPDRHRYWTYTYYWRDLGATVSDRRAKSFVIGTAEINTQEQHETMLKEIVLKTVKLRISSTVFALATSTPFLGSNATSRSVASRAFAATTTTHLN